MIQPRRLLTVLALLGAVLTMGILGGCSKPEQGWPDKPGLRVMASFPPLYCFTANVAGEHAHVQSLLDATGIHEYHPSPHQAIALHQANLFIINGLGLDEDFSQTLVNNADNPKLKVIEIGEDERLKPRLRKMDEHADHDEKDHKGHAHAHKHGEFDPHIWLGLPEAILMVEIIGAKLGDADKDHAANYKANADAYIEKLKQMQKDGEAAFKNKKNKKLVSFHDSLAYFARAFGLNVVKTIQPAAGEEATSGARLAELVELCKKENIKVIAVEPNQMANSTANALLNELKAKGIKDVSMVEVEILESVPRADLTPDYYEKKMKKNIEDLAKAMPPCRS